MILKCREFHGIWNPHWSKLSSNTFICARSWCESCKLSQHRSLIQELPMQMSSSRQACSQLSSTVWSSQGYFDAGISPDKMDQTLRQAVAMGAAVNHGTASSLGAVTFTASTIRGLGAPSNPPDPLGEAGPPGPPCAQARIALTAWEHEDPWTWYMDHIANVI